MPYVGGPKVLILLIRRLRLTDPHPYNAKVVSECNHYPYAYESSQSEHGDVLVDCVLPNQMRRRVILGSDMHDISLRYSSTTLILEISENLSERPNL